MRYEKRHDKTCDNNLVRFIDKDDDGFDIVHFVRFKFDLAKDQIDAVIKAAEDVEYDSGYETFDIWVETVLKEAMKDPSFKREKNPWKFDDPYPCLEIEM